MESIEQKIFSGSSPFPRKINVGHFSIANADDAVTYLLQDQPLSTSIIPVGVSCHSANKGGIDFMTFSTTTTAVLITINKKKVQNPPNNFLALLSPGENIVDGTQSRCCLVGFSMDRSAIQISRATQHKVRGVDLGHVAVSAKKEHLRPLDIVVQETKPLSVDKWRVSQLWMGTNKSSKSDTCVQSWLAACVGTRAIAKLKAAERVDSAFLKSSQELQCLSDLVTQSALLDRQQPKEISNEFSNAGLNKQGKFEVGNSRYKTRIRPGNESRVILTSSDGQHHIGHAQSSKGKKTIIDRKGGFSSVGPIRQIKIQGRQDPTNSEKAQDQFIYMLLTGETNLRRSAFIRDIWFPTSKKIHRITLSAANPSHINTTLSTMVLNDSQRKVVHAVCGDAPIVIVHGPPGTGKTTTISASSRIWAEHRFPAWIVAHSNVAVKNIAESLSKRSVSYKLIVSKEFYAEWHEHLYDGVEDNLIRSDDLPKDIVAMERLLGDSHIILCTLSMVFCPALQANRTFEIVPMERLIIDEASQINVFEFMAVFEKFHKTLGKICFFGDPKQLPPYGKDDVPSIKTIFDIKHLSNAQKDFFLDTQYRMPVPIGHFLSARVYDGRLQSVHSTEANSCVAFINVPISRGPEKQVGKSYKNDGEVQTVVHLVKHYYKHQNFCIITPYDLQRAAIQAALKAENLPADSVFAVDSFQGNEADFIIVSAVRTGKPGFLVSLNRMNVTLSRCKKGMVIVASQDFLQAGGAKTLLGELAKHWEKAEGGSKVWREWQTVASGSADLPGVLGPHRPSRPRRIP